MARLKKYLVISSQTAQTALAYRITFFISLLSGLIQALVLYYIWQVVFSGRTSLNGFDFPEMVTYIFVSYAIKNLYGFYTETAISSKIRDGSVSFELIRPLNYQLARFFESLGSILIEGLIIGILVLVIGAALFGMRGPASAGAGIAFTLSVVFSLLINFSLCFIVGLISFWSTSVFGLVNSKRLIVDFLSGGLIPLAFFPGWLKTIALVLPFHGIVSSPVLIYLGKITGPATYIELFKQAAWAVLLWLAGSVLWLQARKTVTIHGG